MIVRTLVLLLVTVTAMIAQRALSVTVTRVRLLIAHPAPTRIVVIANNALSVLLLHAANTPRVHVPSARSHSSVRNVRNTCHVQRVHSSTKRERPATRSAQQVRLQLHQLTVAIVRHVALPSRLNTLRR